MYSRTNGAVYRIADNMILPDLLLENFVYMKVSALIAIKAFCLLALSLYLSLTCHHQNFILPYTAENFSIVWRGRIKRTTYTSTRESTYEHTTNNMTYYD